MDNSKVYDKQHRYLGKGIKKPRFRTPTKNTVKNRILMALLYGTNTKISELAEAIGVSKRTAHSWVYERNPGEANRKKISEFFGLPEDVLFFEHCEEMQIKIPFETKLHQGFLGDKILNVILAGLMVVHNINHRDLAEYLGYSRPLFRTHIHEGRIPPIEIIDKVCKFFKLPPHIIYNPDLFLETRFTAKEFRPYYSKSKQ
ncbi:MULTISPECIES: helix-turn-helix transcriptional regulator [unclassified Paenibacillus]|uniref:XRE family transcriptional regulator n=2 Tax=Bacillati TaxID=1783272 RepID=A0ABW3PZW0_9BACL|nr:MULTISPECIES: helix-turn-helix transcriptional regulator [unclassified Paenibacillus]MCM3130222.1 helix-turn-helix domain-containing protein [Paenibacillus sp. MER 78]